jgi:Type II secretion system (T2SS), protein M subtype b
MTSLKSLLPEGRNAWLLTGGITGVALMAVLLALGPIRHTFRELDVQVLDQEKKLAYNLGVLSPKPREAVEKDFNRFGSLIKMKGSSEEEKSSMLSEVDKLAGQNKIALSATKPLDIKPLRDCEMYAVEIEIEATMAQLLGFVYAVETSEQLLRVDRLTLDAKAGKGADSLRGTLVISKMVTL